VVSWTPPEVGVPDLYVVTLVYLRVLNGRPSFQNIIFYCEDNSFRIPPEILVNGNWYALVISARVSEGMAIDTPGSGSALAGSADCVTARFTP
jgi:hypothetical protein